MRIGGVLTAGADHLTSWARALDISPRSRVTLFRGMTPGVPKHVRVLKDVQAMHDDPDHFLLIEALAFEGGTFLPLPEPAYRLEFVGNSITSGEGAIGAVCEEDLGRAVRLRRQPVSQGPVPTPPPAECLFTGAAGACCPAGTTTPAAG